MSPEQGHLAAVRAAHEPRLLAYPHVIGVAEGVHDGQPALLVFVTRREPPTEPAAGEILPEEIDGVPVRIIVAGQVEPQRQPQPRPGHEEA
jgi:hypothetical protein